MIKKILLPAFIVIIVLVASVGIYIYNKPHKNYEKANVDYEITAEDLINEFEVDEAAANQKYLDKIILVTGTVQDVNKNEEGVYYVALYDPLFGITCTFQKAGIENIKQLKVGNAVSIKGRCDGKLDDIRLTQCFIANNNSK